MHFVLWHPAVAIDFAFADSRPCRANFELDPTKRVVSNHRVNHRQPRPKSMHAILAAVLHPNARPNRAICAFVINVDVAMATISDFSATDNCVRNGNVWPCNQYDW